MAQIKSKSITQTTSGVIVIINLIIDTNIETGQVNASVVDLSIRNATIATPLFSAAYRHTWVKCHRAVNRLMDE